MSYCRWSTGHFECDVYVYEHIGGYWTTHVAGRRRRNKLPEHIKDMFPEWNEDDAVDRYMAAKDAEEAWLRSQPHTVIKAKDTSGKEVSLYHLADSEFEPLPSPHAGQTYNYASPGECATGLLKLREAGFNVPQHAIDALLEEEKEE